MNMEAGEGKLVEIAVQLAARLPTEILEMVVRAVRESPSATSPAARTRITQDIPHPYYRDIANDFLDRWRCFATELSPHEAALILLTAGRAEDIHRKSQAVELVWTGPEANAGPFRRTEQAVLQVLDSAQQRITLVSYAVYSIPRIGEALVRAARRGVQIKVIVETPNKCEGQNEYDTIHALGPDVASCAAVYYWPEENRAVAEGGKVGILHVKCAVADGRWLFLSSANLTEYAFSINMELGVLVTGGVLPGQVETQFDELIGNGVLVRV
jgi:phosphatidylserine/phosphatidylglycerophosphate/cardiolipin synthase-like enzyme